MDSSLNRLEPGYWELRVNWTDHDLMLMTPEQTGSLKLLIAQSQGLAQSVTPPERDHMPRAEVGSVTPPGPPDPPDGAGEGVVG